MVTFNGDIPMSRVKKFLDWWYSPLREIEIMEKIRARGTDYTDIRNDPTLSPREKQQKIIERAEESVQRRVREKKEKFKNLSQEEKDNIFRNKR
jgi:hypothetical protein